MTQRYYPWTFLPEGKGDPASAEGSGITRASASPSAWLAELAGGMLTVGEPPAWAAPDVLNADARCLRALENQNAYEAVWRGALAAALLWDAWMHPRSEARMALVRLDEEEAGFTGAVLQAMTGKSHALTLIALEDWEHGRAPLGFLSKKTLITPAANLTGLAAILPARVAWFDSARGTFADPCGYVNDQDRVLLSSMLMQLHVKVAAANPVLGGALGRFLTALETSRAARAERAEKLSSADSAMLETHLLIAAGLQPEAVFTMLTVRQDGYLQGENRIMAALGADFAADTGAGQPVWLWRGCPFMRQDAQMGLERIPGAAAEAAIAEMTAELDRLLCNSPAWCGRTAGRLQAMLTDGVPDVVRKVGEGLLQRLSQLAHAAGEEAVLTYPWADDSGAVRLLITETLGEGWEDVLTPFSDKLALVDAQSVAALGMQSLQLCGDGTVPGDMMEFAAVPPISAHLAQQLVKREGATLLMDGVKMLCHADASGNAGVTAQMALQGMRRLVLRCRYDEEDIISLDEAETPTVAVWPSIPLGASGWRSYYVYANCGGDVQVEALEAGEWKHGESRQAADDPQVTWTVLHTTEYPACVMLRTGENCLGMLPNMLPDFRMPVRPPAVIALDVGASGTAVAIAQGADAVPLYCASTRRMLMQGANRTLPDYAFVDGGAVQPVFNSAVETFRDGRDAWHTPVMDAHIATHSPFSAQAKANSSRVHWGLKWGYGEDSAALRKQYLGNLMQTAVQTAVTMGSTSVSWRISMPADMAGEGKRALLRTMEELAGEIAYWTGIPLTEGVQPVSWSDESVAVGHYFRKLSRQPVHGGFMTLDIGGGSSKLLLWLRGMPQPSFTLTLPMGAQHMLLEAMLADPNCLAQDFARLADEGLQERLHQLTEQFTRARTDVRALEMARYMLDELLARDLPKLHQYMNSQYTQGTCSRTQALLLLQVSFLLMLAGTVQEQVYRDSTLNDMLPPYMEICLAGRGTQLMYGFNNMLQRKLSGFVRLPMSREHPTHEFAFIPSDAMKLEAALGLARLPETETGLPDDYVPQDRRFARAIDPVEMLRRFLWHFRMEMPLAAMRLFPMAYDAHGGLTQAADARLRACAANAFANQGTSVEQNCTAWLVTMLQWMS